MNRRRPQLEDFAVLFYASALTGLLETGEGHFRSRLPWAVGYVLISLLPFIPGLFLPQCPTKCGEVRSRGRSSEKAPPRPLPFVNALRPPLCSRR